MALDLKTPVIPGQKTEQTNADTARFINEATRKKSGATKVICPAWGRLRRYSGTGSTANRPDKNSNNESGSCSLRTRPGRKRKKSLDSTVSQAEMIKPFGALSLTF